MCNQRQVPSSTIDDVREALQGVDDRLALLGEHWVEEGHHPGDGVQDGHVMLELT